MFEKEAKEHSNETLCSVCENPTCTEDLRCREWRDRRAGFYCGAKFGYNKANEWHYVKEKLPPEPEIKDGISYPLTYICAYRIRDNENETGNFMYMGNGEFLGENKEYPIYAWLSPSVTIPEFKE